MNWDELEAVVRGQGQPIEDAPLALGQPVAWMLRDHDKADSISAVHCHYENGRTFCRLAIPPKKEQLPPLPSLKKCKRCEAMAARALHYARLASVTAMRASA